MMNYRTLSRSAMALALLAMTVPALAAKEAPKTHDGKVVSVTDKAMVMTGKDGQEHSHALTADTELTLDGKACQASDLKAGVRIRVTLDDAKPQAAIRIEAIDKNLNFAGIQHDGKVVSIKGNKLVMTAVGDEEHTCTLARDVKVTCDGNICKSSDLKAGMRIRVTSQAGNPLLAGRIEALDKNPEFAGS